MKWDLFARNMLVFLQLFLAVGAFYGGLALVIEPRGSLLKMDTEIFHNMVFSNFLVPGIILLVVFGIFPVFIAYCLLKKPRLRLFEKLNLITDHYFAWTFSIYIGVGLIIWINVQLLMIESSSLLQSIYSFYGVLIICVSLLPGVRKHYVVK